MELVQRPHQGKGIERLIYIIMLAPTTGETIITPKDKTKSNTNDENEHASSIKKYQEHKINTHKN